MGDFANSVLNFSWQTDRKDLPGIEGTVVEVGPELSAVDAARLARDESLSILAVRDPGGRSLGFFLPDYLAEVLPDHDLPMDRGVVFEKDADLTAMITALDDALVDFHSEVVNVAPNLRRCPMGHLVRMWRCSTHGVETEEWP